MEPNGAESGEVDLLTAYISVTPSETPRMLAVEHVSLPPLVENDLGVPTPVHFTMFNALGDWVTVPESTVCAIWNTGDVNLDLSLTASDVIAVVNYVFKSGASLYPCEASGDVNCSGQVTSADIIHLVNHVFKGGAPPCDVCMHIPGTWSCGP
jgi:hypothetical protein